MQEAAPTRVAAAREGGREEEGAAGAGLALVIHGGGGGGGGMVGRMVRSCVQTALKAVNSVVGLAGMAVILYALCVYAPRVYTIIVFVLIILQGAITVDVFLNSNWEEDFPPDPSGKFDEFKDLVRSNFEICESVGLSVVAAQVLSIILGMVLRTLEPDRETDYDSDDDATVPARLPLLRNQSQHSPDYAEPDTSRRSDSWKLRILDK
ncbi:hypothetical protein BAE44_0012487, partial [Dichanthelium oligosanthes]